MRDAHRLPHDLIEIDEHFAPQQVVELVLARGVLAHQPLQGRHFVRGVVIDVQVGPRPKPRVDEVDEPLEGHLLLVAAQRLERREDRRAGIDRDGAEQVLEASTGLEVRIAFHVEEDVARRRRRQQSKACPLVDRQQVVAMLAGTAMMRLQRGLMTQPLEREAADADLRVRVEARELRDRPDARVVERATCSRRMPATRLR